MESRRMKVSDSHSIRLLLLPSPIVPRLFCLATSTISLTLHLCSHVDPTNGAMNMTDRSVTTLQREDCDSVLTFSDRSEREIQLQGMLLSWRNIIL